MKSFTLNNDIAIPVNADRRKVAELCCCVLRLGLNDVEIFHANKERPLIRSS
jgi:hypothetical protein